MVPPAVPLYKLSPKTFCHQTLHKCVGNCTTMGANCGILNLTFQRILCRFIHVFAKLKAINSTDSFKQLPILNVASDFSIHSDEMTEVWEVCFSTILQLVNNLFRQFLTQMGGQFFNCKLIERQQFFIQCRRNWLRQSVRNHAQDLSNVIHLPFNLIAVDNNLNGGVHWSGVWAAAVVCRWGNHAPPEPTHTSDLVPPCQLSQQQGSRVCCAVSYKDNQHQRGKGIPTEQSIATAPAMKYYDNVMLKKRVRHHPDP